MASGTRSSSSLSRRWSGRVVIAAGAAAIVLVLLVAASVRRIWIAAPPPADELDRGANPIVIAPVQPIHEFALAPDGKRLAFTATAGGERHLVVRSLAAAGERTIEGTEGASHPFWSDDGQFVAYFADGSLRTIAATGGTPAVIADGNSASAGAWSGDVILFSRGAVGGRLHQVSTDGGTPQPVTALRDGEVAHGWPAFLPGGARFLYTIVKADGSMAIHAGALDGAAPREVLADASRLVVADGYVVYLRQDALTVQPFDLETLIPRGDPIQVSEGHPGSGGGGVRAFSLSSAGMLAYQVNDSSVSLIDWRTGYQR